MTTYKLQLTEHDWLRALRGDKPNAIADGLQSQQPELYGRLLSQEVAARQSQTADTVSEPPKTEQPATAPANVEDAGPKAPVRKSGKPPDKS